MKEDREHIEHIDLLPIFLGSDHIILGIDYVRMNKNLRAENMNSFLELQHLAILMW